MLSCIAASAARLAAARVILTRMPYASRAPEVDTLSAAVPVPVCDTADSLPAVDAVARHPTTGPAP
jgi:hypothetical protein